MLLSAAQVTKRHRENTRADNVINWETGKVEWDLACEPGGKFEIDVTKYLSIVAKTKTEADFRAKLWKEGVVTRAKRKKVKAMGAAA